MVNYNMSLDQVFSSLSDPTRRMILYQIALGKKLSFTEIAKPHPISSPAVSKHLQNLTKSHLIKREKRGKRVFYSLSPKTLKSVDDYLSFYQTYWSDTMDRLEKYLTKTDEKEVSI